MPPPTGSPQLAVAIERWPLAEAFVISRGSKTAAEVVVATLACDGVVGRGECVPYARYGETVAGVAETLRALAPLPGSRAELQRRLPPGAARNALDCAFWDLEAKRARSTVAALAGLPMPAPVTTCYTLSLASPDEMAAKAARVPHYPLLKLKLGGAGDAERMAAVRAARPDARLVADANEAWSEEMLSPLLAAAAAARFELVEQPLPAGADAALATTRRPVPVCADESAHTAADIAALATRYDAVNIKLDKAGGLTAAIEMAAAARAANLRIMVGCMVATSLAMAPALLLAPGAAWVDLDGPLLLAADRPGGLGFTGATITPPDPALWG